MWMWHDVKKLADPIKVSGCTSICRSTIMSTSLVERIESDDAYALATSDYPGDFQATRDRSLPNGEIFTFKSCSVSCAPTARNRGFLYKYETAVFGQIDEVKVNVSAFAFTLSDSALTKTKGGETQDSTAAYMSCERVMRHQVDIPGPAASNGYRYQGRTS
jgi:hypothetical protein